MKKIEQRLSYASPKPGIVAYEMCNYSKPAGFDMIRARYLEVGDDLFEELSLSFSTDNGQTWPESRPIERSRKTPDGIIRTLRGPSFVDPRNGRLLVLSCEGLYPNDNALDGMKQTYVVYQTSEDGGRTDLYHGPLVEEDHTPEHPLRDVRVGSNAAMTVAMNSVLAVGEDSLLVALQISPPGPDGEYFNPTGAYTWTEILLMFGRWCEDGTIAWRSGPRVAMEPSRSTRGAIEPTLARLEDGKILMVFRGSNGGPTDPEFHLPGYKWFCISEDDGHSWTQPQPWTYDNGEAFHSPSSISQLLQHPNGRLYWFGNTCEVNPRGNLSRYPLIAGEVDGGTGNLIKNSLIVVDDRRQDDPEKLYLSNFLAREDRAAGTIVLHMTRMLEKDGLPGGDSYTYTIEP